jgi:hypothetical protein
LRISSGEFETRFLVRRSLEENGTHDYENALRRLEQVEQRHLGRGDRYVGREREFACKLKRERLRADPNWASMPKPTLAEVEARLQETQIGRAFLGQADRFPMIEYPVSRAVDMLELG